MALSGGYLLDTNILVHLVRSNALGQHVDATYGLSADTNSFLLCVVTVGELYALAIKFGWGPAKRAGLNAILNNRPISPGEKQAVPLGPPLASCRARKFTTTQIVELLAFVPRQFRVASDLTAFGFRPKEE